MAFIQKLSVLIALLTLSLQVSSQGTQFITGPCINDAACASGCCGFNSGKCAGAIIALERDGGCGFGDATPNDNAAQLLRGGLPTMVGTPPAPPVKPIAIPAPPPANTTNPIEILPVNNTIPSSPPSPKGTQFITGVCTSDASCASKCCGFNSGKCAGPIVAQERDGGCGFGNAVSNDDAARGLVGRWVRWARGRRSVL